MAYASTWSLQMPYWMGIYWAGSLENGIHGPPINRYGQVMWEGYIGRPVSYGCIILSNTNVRTLYNWVEIGTPVIVRP
jgi:lipoprotein-anchoring transpeptidase ErfK/SrfK